MTVPSTGRTPDDNGIKYEIQTYNYKLVCDYARLSMLEVMSLDILEYWQLLRDAVIYQAEKTEEGQEWLKDAWAYEQVEPDRALLRKMFGVKK